MAKIKSIKCIRKDTNTNLFPSINRFKKYKDNQILNRIPSINHILHTNFGYENRLNSILKISNRDIKKIEYYTRNQSQNSLWFEYRKHVITASIAWRIKSKSIKKENDFKASLFIGKEGNSSLSHIPSINYGIESESFAKKKNY